MKKSMYGSVDIEYVTFSRGKYSGLTINVKPNTYYYDVLPELLEGLNPKYVDVDVVTVGLSTSCNNYLVHITGSENTISHVYEMIVAMVEAIHLTCVKVLDAVNNAWNVYIRSPRTSREEAAKED